MLLISILEKKESDTSAYEAAKIFFQKKDFYICNVVVGREFPKEGKVLGYWPLAVLEHGLSMYGTFQACGQRENESVIFLHFTTIRLAVDFSDSDGEKIGNSLLVEISQKKHELREKYSFDVKLSGLRSGKYTLGDENLMTALEVALTFTSKLLKVVEEKEFSCVREMKINFL